MSSTYDRIARFYDVDMAQNMRFDDVAFYAHHSTRDAGRVLELGCGNGRILLGLLARGIDATGVDASGPMLGELLRKGTARGLAPHVVRADVRELPFERAFATVLAPYSLPTYMASAPLARGELVPLFEDWQLDPMPLYLAFPPNRHVSLKLRVFIDWIVELMARRGPGTMRMP